MKKLVVMFLVLCVAAVVSVLSAPDSVSAGCWCSDTVGVACYTAWTCESGANPLPYCSQDPTQPGCFGAAHCFPSPGATYCGTAGGFPLPVLDPYYKNLLIFIQRNMNQMAQLARAAAQIGTPPVKVFLLAVDRIFVLTSAALASIIRDPPNVHYVNPDGTPAYALFQPPVVMAADPIPGVLSPQDAADATAWMRAEASFVGFIDAARSSFELAQGALMGCNRLVADQHAYAGDFYLALARQSIEEADNRVGTIAITGQSPEFTIKWKAFQRGPGGIGGVSYAWLPRFNYTSGTVIGSIMRTEIAGTPISANCPH